MTNTDYEQLSALRQQRIDAINADLQRLEDVRHAMTVYGKFTVRTVSRHGNGYKVYIAPVTWGQATIERHVEKAGYGSLGYGTDSGGMFVNVEEK
jgi:hypothetical protein